jgi:hypothetical protein
MVENLEKQHAFCKIDPDVTEKAAEKTTNSASMDLETEENQNSSNSMKTEQI